MRSLSVEVWKDVLPARHVVGVFVMFVRPPLLGGVELTQVAPAHLICGSIAGSDEQGEAYADYADAEACNCDDYLF